MKGGEVKPCDLDGEDMQVGGVGLSGGGAGQCQCELGTGQDNQGAAYAPGSECKCYAKLLTKKGSWSSAADGVERVASTAVGYGLVACS